MHKASTFHSGVPDCSKTWLHQWMIAFTVRGHTWIPAAAGAIDSLASRLYRLALWQVSQHCLCCKSCTCWEMWNKRQKDNISQASYRMPCCTTRLVHDALQLHPALHSNSAGASSKLKSFLKCISWTHVKVKRIYIENVEAYVLRSGDYNNVIVFCIQQSQQNSQTCGMFGRYSANSFSQLSGVEIQPFEHPAGMKILTPMLHVFSFESFLA